MNTRFETTTTTIEWAVCNGIGGVVECESRVDAERLAARLAPGTTLVSRLVITQTTSWSTVDDPAAIQRRIDALIEERQ